MKKIAIFLVVLALIVAGGSFWLNRNLDGLMKSMSGALEKAGSAVKGLFGK